MFSDCQITLELDSSLPFKGKLELKRKIVDNGGIISFIVTKKVRLRELPIVLGEHTDHISGAPVFIYTCGNTCMIGVPHPPTPPP